MNIVIIQLITALLGSLGFAMIFNIPKKYMLVASMGGFICWSVYLLAEMFADGVFIPSLFASACAAFYAEIIARILKVPTTVIFVSSIIPLIPGSSLFYTMSHAVSSDWEQFSEYGMRTVQYIIGISCGISIVWSAGYMIQRLLKREGKKNR